ncbi:MAG: RNA methyltransferase [Flaviflexus sp.]|nr:RNA methyltransferase [Flaviflexus sp.]
MRYHESMTGQLTRLAGLYEAKTRKKFGREIAEGLPAGLEALASAPERVLDVYATEEVFARPEVARLASGHYRHAITPALARKISPSCQGLIVCLERGPEGDIDGILDGDLAVLACEMQDPGNAGSLIRTADAAGADGVLFGRGSADHTSPKVIRFAAGSTYHLPIATGEVADIVAAARGRMQVLAGDGKGKMLGTAEIDFSAPTLWLLGNESRGLGEYRDLADHVVSAPIFGRAESLNATQAAALLMYETARAQHASG